MAVEVTELDSPDWNEEWNRYVERAPSANPFFRAEALTLQAETTGTTLHPLAGFVGQEAVGLFPVFAYRKGPITGAFSPAPFAWTSYLGPTVLNVEKLKRRKVDRRIKQFLEGALSWIDAELSPRYCQFVADFDDVRPFVWNDYTVEPGYTYVVDLDVDPDRLLERFSSDARSNVRNTDPSAYVVEEGGVDDVERIVDQVATRYATQGRSFDLSSAFTRSLYETLPDGAVRPYVCRADDTFLGGIIVIESSTTRYRWQGGVKLDDDVDLPVNDLLDWHVMRDGLESGLERYDLVGAGVPSINRYKAKFNPRLETHYTITDSSFGLSFLIDRYRKFR